MSYQSIEFKLLEAVQDLQNNYMETPFIHITQAQLLIYKQKRHNKRATNKKDTIKRIGKVRKELNKMPQSEHTENVYLMLSLLTRQTKELTTISVKAQIGG